MPVLVLHGERSRVEFKNAARDLTERLADASLAEIPNAGHIGPLTNAEPVARELIGFLRSETCSLRSHRGAGIWGQILGTGSRLVREIQGSSSKGSSDTKRLSCGENPVATVFVGPSSTRRILHGKEGVDGSSPSEGLPKVPANWDFIVVRTLNTRTHSGHICGTRDAPRHLATSADKTSINPVDASNQETTC